MNFNLFITDTKQNVRRIRSALPASRWTFCSGGSAACLVDRDYGNLYKMSPRSHKQGRCLFANAASPRARACVCGSALALMKWKLMILRCKWVTNICKQVERGTFRKQRKLLLWLKATCVTVRTALIIIDYETDRPTTSVFSPIHSQEGVQLPQQVLALVYVATLR